MVTRGLKLRWLIGYTNIERASRVLARTGAFPSYQYDPVSGVYIPRDPTIFTLPPLLASTSTTVNNGSYISPLNRLNMQANLSYDRAFGDHYVSALALYSSSSQTAVTNDQLTNRIPR